MKAKMAKTEGAFPIKRRANENMPARWTAPFDAPFNLTKFFPNDMERFFDRFNAFNLMPRFNEFFEFPRAAAFDQADWRPEIEVIEKKGELAIHADLPGLKKDDIEVEFTDDALIISGERKEENKEEREGYYFSERNYGSFYRTIPLPEGADTTKAHANFHDGVLDITVAVPKLEPRSRKLEITEKAAKANAKTA